MKPIETTHRARPWRVHEIAADFELLDLWPFDLGGHTPPLAEFLPWLWRSMADMSESRLARARVWIGERLRWDDHDFTLPIPGCVETSVASRLRAEDRAASLAPPSAPSPLEVPRVVTVYVFEDEALYEFSNDTIHGLLHLSAPAGEAPTLAVYVKPRGLLSRLYMAAIWPFRHLWVYPAFLRRVTESAKETFVTRTAAAV